MPFEFATAARIVFGPGSLAQAGTLARELGRHALVVTGRDPARAARLLELLASAGVAVTCVRVDGEPTTAMVESGLAAARAAGCDLVIGIGGGSVIDSAKAIAGLLANPGDLLDYLEVIGRARPLARPGLPCIAIPTTAGTGAEVTRNAVLQAETHRVKVSLRSPHLLPRIALIDPDLTLLLPPSLTASTGLDALTQLIEPYTSCRRQPLTDALCVDGLRRAGRSLRRAVDHGPDPAAREDMALASLAGGLALANAGLGAVHGFAGPIGGRFSAPHGAVCAALLAPTLEINLQALRERAPADEAVRRYDEIARLLTDDAHATAADGVRWIQELVTHCGIPRLSAWGVTRADFPVLVESAAKASSMKANPLLLTPAELTAILERALGREESNSMAALEPQAKA